MKTVGLTGGIACGKSTVGRLLEARGIPVVDADRISREVLAPGSAGLAQVLAAFGQELLLPDGQLDRAGLGRRVMQDAEARQRLEAITHPLIKAAIQRRLQDLAAAGHGLAVVEAALMVEAGSFRAYDAVLHVTCAPTVQLARLARRNGWPEAQARQWLQSQLSTEERGQRLLQAEAEGGPRLVELANDGALEDLVQGLDAAWDLLQARLAEGPIRR